MTSKIIAFSLGPVAILAWACLIFNSFVYVVTGVDFLQGDSGTRWVALICLAAFTSLPAAIAWSCYIDTPEYKNKQREKNRG